MFLTMLEIRSSNNWELGSAGKGSTTQPGAAITGSSISKMEVAQNSRTPYFLIHLHMVLETSFVSKFFVFRPFKIQYKL